MGNTRVKFSQVLATNTIANGPKALSPTALWCKSVTVYGMKTLAGAANVGNVTIGPSAAASEQALLIISLNSIVITAVAGCEFNLADWYFIVATDADGVVSIYH